MSRCSVLPADVKSTTQQMPFKTDVRVRVILIGEYPTVIVAVKYRTAIQAHFL
jgi:hypothetical protein